MSPAAKRKFTAIGILHLMVTFAQGSKSSKLGRNETNPRDLYFPVGILSDVNIATDGDSLLARASEKECSADSILAATQICQMLFFQELKSDKDALCSKVYNKLRRCVLSKSNECTRNRALATRVKRSLRKSYTYYLQAVYCNDGSLSLTKLARPINYCGVEYNEKIGMCYGDYHRTFRSNVSDESLCEKYEGARSCAEQAENELCKYDEFLGAIQKISMNGNRCWNPFCVPQVNDFVVKVTDKGLTFSYVRKMIQSKLRALSREIDSAKSYQTVEALRRGVAVDCKFNKAALISKALNEIIKELDVIRSDEQTVVTVTRQATEALPNPLVKRLEGPDEGQDGNGCGRFFVNYVLLFQALFTLKSVYNLV